MSSNTIKSICLFALTSLLFIKCQSVRTGNSTPFSNNTHSETRDEILHFAQKLEGSKYKYAGTSPKKGFDCSGFTYYVMKNFDISLPHNSGAQSTKGERRKIQEAQPGDLVFFGKKGKINHVGLIVSNDKHGLVAIHSSSSRGVITENMSKSTYWKSRILFARDVIQNK